MPQEVLPLPSSDYARTKTLTRDSQRCRSGRAPVTGDTGCQLVYGPTISPSGLADLDHWCIFALCPPGVLDGRSLPLTLALSRWLSTSCTLTLALARYFWLAISGSVSLTLALYLSH